MYWQCIRRRRIKDLCNLRGSTGNLLRHSARWNEVETLAALTKRIGSWLWHKICSSKGLTVGTQRCAQHVDMYHATCMWTEKKVRALVYCGVAVPMELAILGWRGQRTDADGVARGMFTISWPRLFPSLLYMLSMTWGYILAFTEYFWTANAI